MEALLYVIVFIYGLIIGSFLNVLIYRIPKKENFITTRSHCMNCGYALQWYDLVPLFSYLFLRGRCRKCKEKISIQYPLIELLNAILYLFLFWNKGVNIQSVLFCLMTSALIVLSVIDFRTFEIPMGINVFIFFVGILRVVTDYRNSKEYILGFFAVSLFLAILFWVSKGRAIGGGDVKLMAAAGLVVGWKCIIVSFFVACLLGSVIHLLRMKITKEDHVLALGPYLAMGIYISILFGNEIINWYFKCMGL